MALPGSGTPSLRKIVIAGHQLVNADCNKFSPTNAVSHSQFGDTHRASANEASTITPAIKRTARSTVMENLLLLPGDG
jgi:hypothetical protein